jgi:acetyl esterase/lipase
MSPQPAPPPRFVAHRVADLQLRGVAGRRRARAYWPSPSTPATVPALLVLFGADESIFDGVDGSDSLGRALCVLGGVVVLSASPRSGAPPASPVSVDDGVAIVGWAADHAGDLGADPRQLVLAGEGPGATIVDAVARQASDIGWPRIVRHLLVEADGDGPSGDPHQSLVDLAAALRRSLQVTTRRRLGRPRSAGASHD